jgi:hypothetical protein
MLEWCSAAEGPRWQHIMHQAEEKRLTVTKKMIQETCDQLKDTKIPGPRNPRPKDEDQPAEFHCLICDQHWDGIYHQDQERSCPSCRSNSVHWLRKR